MGHSKETLTLEPVLSPRKKLLLGVAKRAVLVGAATLSLSIATDPAPDSIIPTDTSLRITMVAADIGNRQAKEVKYFLGKYAALVDTEEIIVTSDPVEINQNTASGKRFLQRSLISEKAREPLYELENTYDKGGILITASLKTERSDLNLPEINSAIDNVIATEGLLSPNLAGLHEQLLRSAFKLPGGTNCSSGKGSLNPPNEGDGLYTSCYLQTNTRKGGIWNVEATTSGNGTHIDVSDVEKTVFCSIPARSGS